MRYCPRLVFLCLSVKSLEYVVRYILPVIAPASFASRPDRCFWTDTGLLVMWMGLAVLRLWTIKRDLYYQLSDTVVAGGTLSPPHIKYGDASAAQGFWRRWIFGYWDAAGWRHIKAVHTYNKLLRQHTRFAVELGGSQYADMDPAVKQLQLCISDVDLLRARIRMQDASLDEITN